jgi:hypothetical protein
MLRKIFSQNATLTTFKGELSHVLMYYLAMLRYFHLVPHSTGIPLY